MGYYGVVYGVIILTFPVLPQLLRPAHCAPDWCQGTAIPVCSVVAAVPLPQRTTRLTVGPHYVASQDPSLGGPALYSWDCRQ